MALKLGGAVVVVVVFSDDKTTKPVVLEIYYDTNDLICQMYILSRVSRTWQEVGEDPGKSNIVSNSYTAIITCFR